MALRDINDNKKIEQLLQNYDMCIEDSHQDVRESCEGGWVTVHPVGPLRLKIAARPKATSDKSRIDNAEKAISVHDRAIGILDDRLTAVEKKQFTRCKGFTISNCIIDGPICIDPGPCLDATCSSPLNCDDLVYRTTAEKPKTEGQKIAEATVRHFGDRLVTADTIDAALKSRDEAHKKDIERILAAAENSQKVLIAEAVKAEREACAKIAESASYVYAKFAHDPYWINAIRESIAAASFIRARKHHA